MRTLNKVVFLWMLCSVLTYAQDDETVTLGTTVSGNQEQPKVLYIVPWKEARDDTILYQGLDGGDIGDVFGHVERSKHRRQIQFLNELDKKTTP